MPVSKERENRLKYGYGERSQILVLDLNMKNEGVSYSEYLSNPPKMITKFKIMKSSKNLNASN